MIEPESNVVPFRRRAAPARHPKALIETVYAAGSLTLKADERPAKLAALMLHALGFLVIHEILTDGTPQLLKRGEARRAMDRPWRLSKPPFSGVAGIPDAGGAFLKSLN